MQCTEAYQISHPYYHSRHNPSKHPDCVHRLTWAKPHCCFLFFCLVPLLVCSRRLMHFGGMGCWTFPSCPHVLSWHWQESFCLPCSRKNCKQDCKSLGERRPLMSALSNGTSGTKPLIKGLKLNSNKLIWSLMMLWNQWPEPCCLQQIWASS